MDLSVEQVWTHSMGQKMDLSMNGSGAALGTHSMEKSMDLSMDTKHVRSGHKAWDRKWI